MAFFEDDRTREQDRLTAEAFEDPKPGDRFHEMMSSWVIVVEADSDGVKAMYSWGPPNTVRGRFPDGEIVEPFPERAEVRWFATAADFRAQHAYGTIPGYNVLLADRGKVDVTGWLERAKNMPAAPTHPKPPPDPVEPLKKKAREALAALIAAIGALSEADRAEARCAMTNVSDFEAGWWASHA